MAYSSEIDDIRVYQKREGNCIGVSVSFMIKT